MRLITEPRLGIGAARNVGERAAKGEIILMTDSDCILPRNWISEMTAPIVNGRHVAVQGVKRNATLNYWTEHIEGEERRQYSMRRKDKKIGLLDTANFAIKRSILEEVGYTDSRIVVGNDTELDVRLKMKGYDIHAKPVKVLHHHPGTAKELFRKIFTRGAWDWKIRRMYLNRKGLFTDVGPVGHLRFLAGVLGEFLTLHDNFRYDMITGIAWRAGAVYGWFRGNGFFANPRPLAQE